ncbi:MAG TPA: hypothetical protein VH560_00315 [Polyangia bacterium]|jgi:hypothetical protein|nr:hypothetical protein [Polyangia bacterium]
MNASDQKRRARARAAIGASFALALVYAGFLAQNVLAQESKQALALVADGRRAFARDDRPAAVLALERARLFAPRSAEVRGELAALGARDAEPAPAAALRLVTAREWAAIATTCGWACGVALALWIARRRRVGAPWTAIVAGAGFAVAMGGLAASNAWPLGVASADARLLLAPYAAASPLGPLPGGATLVVGEWYHGFVHVQAGDGAVGWAPASSVERVASSPD